MVRPDSSGGLPSPQNAAVGGSLDETRPNRERFFEEYPGVRLRQFAAVSDPFRRQSRNEFAREVSRFESGSRPDAVKKELHPAVTTERASTNARRARRITTNCLRFYLKRYG